MTVSSTLPEFQNLCASYLTELRTQTQNPHSTGELSLRAALDNLLQGAKKLSEREVVFTGEGKKLASGRPDFIVSHHGVPIGYIEAEKIDSDLDKLSGHAKEQNERFIQNLDHFLLTNHLDFRLFEQGKLVAEASLPPAPEKGAPIVPEAKAEKLYALLEQLMKAAPPPITSPLDLAQHLSRRARQMRAAVLETLHDEPDAEIHNDYRAFKEVLLPNLDEAEFADMYAQTIAYGLFAARCSWHGGEKFTRYVAGNYLIGNPFLKKLFTRFAGELDASLAWIADDMAALLADAPMEDIQQYFFKRTGNADPMIDFYEPFLQAYNPRQRDLRGVYYTPQPVVGYIVRSLHHLLKTHWNKPQGLADESTLILDPATGTGSFLFGVIDQIHDEVTKTSGSGAWGGYVEKHLLRRVFGFELMMAPYSIAHLKLGLQLAGQGAPVVEGERFNVFLTNALDAAEKKGDIPLSEWLSDEANAAVRVKDKEPILVVLGNPPYSGQSANKSDTIKELAVGDTYEVKRKSGYITTHVAKTARVKHEKTFVGQLIEKYKIVDGAPLGEKNPKMLQDDYVKFIAVAQERIRKTGEGVIGFITNHGYLDNPTFRGMRQSLLNTFNEIYVLDLHGNSRKKEKSPDGSANQNVFEIQQGVAILLCVKEKGNVAPARVLHADLWGKREEKYSWLDESDVSATEWQELQPLSPMYFFVPQDTELLPEYEQGWKVTDIFDTHAVGFRTHRDQIAIAFEEEELKTQVTNFLQKEPPADVWNNSVHPCHYRPFDNRLVCLHKDVAERPRLEVIRNMFEPNISMNLMRQTKAETWQHCVVSDKPTPAVFVEIKDVSSVFPLYLYPDQSTLSFDDERRPNFNPSFLQALGEKMGLPLDGEHGLPRGLAPEDIFHYAYAIFHAPQYRARYAPFLKTDFPRLPLASDLSLFRALAELGEKLVALHLLDEKAAPVLTESRHRFEVKGADVVEKVEYSAATKRVKINATQGFEKVPPEVWQFRVGGYQVADKWLKDRKGRVLSYDDITHYARVLIALAETMEVMERIDEVIGEFPLR